MSKIEVDTIDTQSSTTLQVGSTNTSLIKIGTSGDTVEYPAGTTFTQSGTQNITSGGAINVQSGGNITIDSGATITNNGTASGFSADLTNLNATNLTSGTIPNARYGTPIFNGSTITDINAANLGSGTVPDARFPATLPALNGSALTSLDANNLGSGTLPDARFPATLPAISGANLTNIQGGTNTPNFEANKSDSNQTIANNTNTKVTFNNEAFDSDNAYASDKFTVPSGKGGKYYFYSAIEWETDDRGIRVIYLYKNGSNVKKIFNQDGHDQGSQMASCGALLNLSAGDYIEVYCYQSTADPENILANVEGTYFGGFKLI